MLSPKVFCLFIKEVAEELRNDGQRGIKLTTLIEEILSLLFADDVVLVSHTVLGLQSQLKVLIRAYNRIGFAVNLSKKKY